MKIVIAPDSFKDCLSAGLVAEAMRKGVLKALPTAVVSMVPLGDGGEGTLDAWARATGAQRLELTVPGPKQEPLKATLALQADRRIAFIEMASAAGLELVPSSERNPMETTTLGVGHLIREAIDRGARRLIVAIGGSATNDGGAGVAVALGYRLLDEQGNDIPPTGGGLERLSRIDASNVDPRIKEVEVEVACDVTNPLLGPTGASAVYGPQKGATPSMVQRLDANLARLARVIRSDLGKDVETIPGAGAAGGLGAGLIAFMGAKLRKGIELMMDAVQLRGHLQDADLCLTGEGSLDSQSAFGKTAAGVAGLAKELDVPAVAIAGRIKGDLSALHQAGLAAAFSIIPEPLDLNTSIERASEYLESTAEQVVRLFAAAHGSKVKPFLDGGT